MKKREVTTDAFGLYKDRFHLMRGQPSKENAVAFCHHNWHKGLLTAKMIKKHECLRKQCPYLEKYEDRDFWIRREKIKQQKKEKKDG